MTGDESEEKLAAAKRRRGTLVLKPQERPAPPPEAPRAAPPPPEPGGARRLQDAFLDEMRRSRVKLTIFLANGVRLEGVLVDHDAYCLLIEKDGRQQLLYKHAVSVERPDEPARVTGEREGMARAVGAPERAKRPSAPTIERVRRRIPPARPR